MNYTDHEFVVQAPVVIGRGVKVSNIDTHPEDINNDAEIAMMLADLDGVFTMLADEDEPAVVEVQQPAPVAIEAPTQDEQGVVVEAQPVATPAPVAHEPVKRLDAYLASIAPAFVDRPATPIICNDADRAIVAQRRYEDIAHAHASGQRGHVSTSLAEGKFKGMLSGDVLDHALVREFAEAVSKCGSRMSDEHIADNVLFLSGPMQLRMGQLCSDAIKAKRARVRKQAPDIRAKLQASLVSTGDAKLSKHLDAWVTLWVADQLVQHACGRRSPEEVSRLVSAMTGEKPKARGNVSVTLRDIDERLGNTCPTTKRTRRGATA